MRHYIALIHNDANSDYGVSFPDLPGVISAGASLDEARRMASEALELHLEGMAEDDEAAPEPSSLEQVMAEAVNRDAVDVLVAAGDAPTRAVRVNTAVRSTASANGLGSAERGPSFEVWRDAGD